ncbi:hypothetical protein TrVFT333_003381 [Trichoderma virens FT-333]|nr:hypothetical protein TrVFT333_003381 [Trichoderma virens FT-333]
MEIDAEGRKLCDYVDRSLNEEEDFHFLRLEFLQRLNIVNLQVKLVQTKGRIQRENKVSAEDLEELRISLQQYATAIRDYQCLRNKKSVEKVNIQHRKLLLQKFFDPDLDPGDPFESHYSYFQDANEEIDPIRSALMRYLPVHLAFSRQECLERGKEFAEGKRPRLVSDFVDRLVRFLMAFTGGVFLVVPMIIMTLHPSQTKSLVTVSVAVIIFSLVLSFGVRVSNIETLVSTATYAAVLVVFVGTSTNGGITHEDELL